MCLELSIEITASEKVHVKAQVSQNKRLAAGTTQQRLPMHITHLDSLDCDTFFVFLTTATLNCRLQLNWSSVADD